MRNIFCPARENICPARESISNGPLRARNEPWKLGKKEHPSLPQQRRPLDSPQPPQPRLFVVVEELLRRVVERRRAVARAARAEELVPLRPLDGLGVVALLVALHRRERRRLDDRGDARVRDVREAEVERDLLDLEGASSARAVSAEDAGGTTAAGRSVFMSS